MQIAPKIEMFPKDVVFDWLISAYFLISHNFRTDDEGIYETTEQKLVVSANTKRRFVIYKYISKMQKRRISKRPHTSFSVFIVDILLSPEKKKLLILKSLNIYCRLINCVQLLFRIWRLCVCVMFTWNQGDYSDKFDLEMVFIDDICFLIQWTWLFGTFFEICQNQTKS